MFVFYGVVFGDGFSCPLPNAISDVRRLQVAGAYLLGESGPNMHFADRLEPAHFFLVDARNNHVTMFSEERQLYDAGARLHLAPALRPVGDVYSKFSRSWFDIVSALLLLAPPAATTLLLFRRLAQNP